MADKAAHALAVAGSGLVAGMAVGMVAATHEWFKLDPVAWARGFWSFFLAASAPLVPCFLLAIAAFNWSLRLDWDAPGDARGMWFFAISMYAAVTVANAVYFIPENLRIRRVVNEQGEAAASELAAMRTAWVRAHLARAAALVAAFVVACVAALDASAA